MPVLQTVVVAQQGHFFAFRLPVLVIRPRPLRAPVMGGFCPGETRVFLFAGVN